ncbi:MAG: DUF1579 domain-containing protein [Planctomycetota bacterium]|nr:DUF1579 domain-containing protein [Planctomycetota bacterium]
MNLRNVILVALVAGLAGLWAGVSLAEEEAPSEQEMMAEAMKMGMPGKHHEYIKAMEGEWTTDGTFYMQGQAVKSKGTSSNKMINGGRFLLVHYNAPFAGMPFEGRAIIGHNNFKKQFESLWIDTFGSGMDIKTGSCSEDGKTITFKGEWEFKWGTYPVRQEFKILSADQHKLTSWSTQPDGKELKEMEIIYTRKK